MARVLKLPHGGVVVEGGTFAVLEDDGTVAEYADARLTLPPPDSPFGETYVSSGERTWLASRCYASRRDGVRQAAARLEADLAVWRNAIARDEARLKRLYAQRAELEALDAAAPPGAAPGAA